jgi:hypothetical protein
MNRRQIFAASLGFLALFAAGISHAQQTPIVTQNTPATWPMPTSPSTPADPTRPTTIGASKPMTKSQLKTQRAQQKQQEKLASANANTAKAEAKARKQHDKALQAQEKANAKSAAPTPQ